MNQRVRPRGRLSGLRGLSRLAALAAKALVAVAILGLSSESSAPEASFTVSTPNPAAGALVAFADSSAANSVWAWDFGDGAVASIRNPTHVYGSPGQFMVRLVAQAPGGESSATMPLTVTGAGVLRLNASHAFDVTLSARDPRTGRTGEGVVIGQNDVYGYFSLPSLSGNAGNPEVIVKIVDASSIGQNYWVFYAALTDLDYTLSVQENATGIVKNYTQDPSRPAGQFDTSGFAGVPTPTPTAAPPTPTATPAGVQEITIDTKAWEFSPGGAFSPPLVVAVGSTYRLRFHNVDPPGTVDPNHGFTGISEMGISASPGNPISPGHDYVTEVFTPQAFDRGSHPFACTNTVCGGDPQQHPFMVGNLIVQ